MTVVSNTQKGKAAGRIKLFLDPKRARSVDKVVLTGQIEIEGRVLDVMCYFSKNCSNEHIMYTGQLLEKGGNVGLDPIEESI